MVCIHFKMDVYEPLSAVSTGADAHVDADVKLVLRDLWCLPDTPTRLPCSNPCSLMRADLPTLRTQPYVVGAKTDGVRFYLLLSYLTLPGMVEKEYAVLIDRAFRAFQLELDAPPALYEGTLLDGELVVQDGALTFVAFDVVASAGFAFRMQVHSKRLAELSRVLSLMTCRGLKMEAKPWLPLTPASVRRLFMSDSPIPSDGLIFVAERKQLVPGMQRDMFKWKPAEANTIDFVRSGGSLLLAGDLGLQDAGAAVNVLPVDPWPPEYAEEGIVECECAVSRGHWVASPRKRRRDKSSPNSVRVAIFTLQNIDENITAVELIDLAADKVGGGAKAERARAAAV